MDKQTTSPIDPLLLTDQQGAALLNIGVSYFRRLVASGDIAPVPVRLGRRRLHRRDLLELWVRLGLPRRTDRLWRQAVAKNPEETALAPAPGDEPAVAVTAGHEEAGG